jgi:general secretion pathway protein D
VAVVLLATAGCTSYRAARRAEIATQLGNWDEAVLYYMEALEQDPTNISHRAALLRAQVEASRLHFEKGRQFHEAGVLERALVELQQAVQLDSSNQYAQVELQKVRDEIRTTREARATGVTVEELKERTRGSRPQPPLLNPKSDEPISLEFPEMTPVKSIYQALAKAFGLNVLFDPNLRDQEITITLKDVTAQDALEILMRASGHFYKVVDEQTIIIAADTPQNRRTYEDLVIQVFFLSNADVKDVLTILRSLIGAKQLAMNEQLNAIILRDTADKVKVAERIIETIDKAKAEVVVDVELLQLNTNKIRELGAQLESYSVTQALDLGGEDVPLRFSELEFLNANNWTLTIPNFIYNFVKTNTDAQLLAKPKLRISEGEQARLVIGDRVPIPVTSFNTANTVGGNIVPITSFQYQDVGITIQIQPRIHHNREVTLDLTVEVSQVSGSVSGGTGGASQPIIGTRTIESTIRLKDGETNFLAGLIRSDDADTENGLPGLSEIPVLGRLFSNNRTESRRTDVILTLTPHIVRLPDITEEDLLPIWVGTEANITFRGGSPQVESNIEGPFDGADEASPEEIRRRIRERLQRLPRGLREAEQPTDEQQPAGQELVPGSLPSSPFEQPPPPFEEEPEVEFEEEPPLANALGLQTPEELGIEESELQLAQAAVAGGWVGDSWIEGLAADAAAYKAASDAELEEAASFTSLASVTSSPLAREGEVTVWLLPEVDQVRAGETFDVVVEARALAPVSHLPLTLVYDPDLLAVEAVEKGDFLGDDAAAELLTDNSRAGQLMVGASRLGEVPGVAGAGDVAVVTFRALATGPARISFDDSRALDADLRPLGFVGRPVSVTVGEGASSPVTPELPSSGPIEKAEEGDIPAESDDPATTETPAKLLEKLREEPPATLSEAPEAP